MNILKSYAKSRVLYVLLLIAGCGGGGGSSPQVQVQDPTGSDSSLTVLLTDAPVDTVIEVWVEFVAVEIKPEEGESITVEFEEPMQIDLLTLTGDETTPLLDGHPVDPGKYNWIRLDVNADEDGIFDSFVMTEMGEMIELEVVSQQGLRLVSGFEVADGGDVSLILDWDLRKGLNMPKGANQDAWRLKPAIRIANMDTDSTAGGTVEESLLTDESCTNDLAEDTGNAVYLYAGHDAVTEDIHTEETDPVATAEVHQDENGFYTYQMDFIEPGDYTIAFTCQALDDDPETDDEIAFVAPANITIGENEEVNHDFGG